MRMNLKRVILRFRRSLETDPLQFFTAILPLTDNVGIIVDARFGADQKEQTGIAGIFENPAPEGRLIVPLRLQHARRGSPADIPFTVALPRIDQQCRRTVRLELDCRIRSIQNAAGVVLKKVLCRGGAEHGAQQIGDNQPEPQSLPGMEFENHAVFSFSVTMESLPDDN